MFLWFFFTSHIGKYKIKGKKLVPLVRILIMFHWNIKMLLPGWICCYCISFLHAMLLLLANIFISFYCMKFIVRNWSILKSYLARVVWFILHYYIIIIITLLYHIILHYYFIIIITMAKSVNIIIFISVSIIIFRAWVKPTVSYS